MTIGQIEDRLAKTITSFYHQTIGYGPKETHVRILSDMIIVRLKGQLLPLEKELLKDKKGIDLVKNIHELMHEAFTTQIGLLVKKITKCRVISSHSDVSTKTEEMIEIFILEQDYESQFKNHIIKNQTIKHKGKTPNLA